MKFEKFYWGSEERYRCPSPCRWDHDTLEAAEKCFAGCRHHPKPIVKKVVKRVVVPQPVVIEEVQELALAPFVEPEADGTGEP